MIKLTKLTKPLTDRYPLTAIILIIMIILGLVMALMIYSDDAADSVQVVPIDWEGFDSRP